MNIFSLLSQASSPGTEGNGFLKSKIATLEQSGELTEEMLQDPRKLFGALLAAGLLEDEQPLSGESGEEGEILLPGQDDNSDEPQGEGVLFSLFEIAAKEGLREEIPALQITTADSGEPARPGDEEKLLNLLASLERIRTAEGNVPGSEKNGSDNAKTLLNLDTATTGGESAPSSEEKAAKLLLEAESSRLPEELTQRENLGEPVPEEDFGNEMGAHEEELSRRNPLTAGKGGNAAALVSPPPAEGVGVLDKNAGAASAEPSVSENVNPKEPVSPSLDLLSRETPSEQLKSGGEGKLDYGLLTQALERGEKDRLASDLRGISKDLPKEAASVNAQADLSRENSRGDLSDKKGSLLGDLRSFGEKNPDTSVSSRSGENPFDELVAASQRYGVSDNAESRTNLEKMPSPSGTLLLNQSGPGLLTEGLARTVRIVRTSEGNRAQIIVDPPALGRVEVSLQATSQGVSALLRVDNEALRQLLQGQMDLLRSSLQQQGIAVTDLSVDVRQDGGGTFSGDENDGSSGKKGTASVAGYDLEEEEGVPVFQLDMEQGLLHWFA